MPECIATIDHPPSVGQEYLVPVALVKAWNFGGHPLLDQPHWWPYRGPAHTDPDFDAYDEHLHFDPRFFTLQERRAIQKEFRSRNTHERCQVSPGTALYNYSIGVETIAGYTREVRICQRHDNRLRPEVGDYLLGALIAKRPSRESWCLKKGRCPHQGYDLRTIPRHKDGSVTCPLHQLTFDKDEKLVCSEGARREANIKKMARFFKDAKK